MGIFSEVIHKAYEQKPSLLLNIPESIIMSAGMDCLKCNDIYSFEQINKYIPLDACFKEAEIESKVHKALSECKIDDFCFLQKLKKTQTVFDAKSIQQAYNTLARRGNVSGLETVIKKTGILPKIDRENVLKSYDVLIAAGRLEAVDYIRQISNVPVQFSEYAAVMGYQYVVLAGKYELIDRMEDITGVKPLLSKDILNKAICDEIKALDFKNVYILTKYTESGFLISYEDFQIGLAGLQKEGLYNRIPYLYTLYGKESISYLAQEVLEKIFLTGDSFCLKFLYSQPEMNEYQIIYYDYAYETAFRETDTELLELLLRTAGKKIKSSDSKVFIEKAIRDMHIEKVNLFLEFTEGGMKVSYEMLQLFFYKLSVLKKTEFFYLFQDFVKEFNYEVGKFINAVESADFSEICVLYENNPDVGSRLDWSQAVYYIAKELASQI